MMMIITLIKKKPITKICLLTKITKTKFHTNIMFSKYNFAL